jgi:hypothetical protein
MNAAEALVRAGCPRCDYDLSGMVASWTESCPMEARCSECGLLFRTPHVLSPKMLGPGWSFEHGPRVLAGRWLRTSVAALSPGKLCRELRVDHRLRVSRLVLFVAVWFLIVHGCSMAMAVASLGVSPRFGGWSGDLDEVLRAVLLPYTVTLEIPVGPFTSTELPLYPVFILVGVPTLLMPLWMTILGATFSHARVRRVHLLRGLAYTAPGAVLVPPVVIVAMVGYMLLARAGAIPLLPVVVHMAVVWGALLAYPVYHSRWWYLFIRDYLHLRHALATVVLMQVMSLLVIAVVLTVVAGYGGNF